MEHLPLKHKIIKHRAMLKLNITVSHWLKHLASVEFHVSLLYSDLILSSCFSFPQSTPFLVFHSFPVPLSLSLSPLLNHFRPQCSRGRTAAGAHTWDPAPSHPCSLLHWLSVSPQILKHNHISLLCYDFHWLEGLRSLIRALWDHNAESMHWGLLI